MNRRQFLKTGGAAVALASMTPTLWSADSPASARRKLLKGIMWSTVRVQGSTLEKMKAIKAAGFDGVEMLSHMDQDEVVRARDEAGLVIPSVCNARHWDKPLTDADPAVRAEGLESLKQALRDAKRYGAASVLLVPGKVTKDVSYADAWTRSQQEIRKAIPTAEELGVKIAIENVWNQFLLSPLEAARFIDEFNSPMVRWHFDVGNIVNYGWPDQWIRILGKRIVQLHVKEFSRGKRDAEGLWKGFAVPLMEGDSDWPLVMRALDDIGYSGGWGIAEQPGGDSIEGLKDLAGRMDRIFAL